LLRRYFLSTDHKVIGLLHGFGAINFITTIVQLRASMSWFGLPFFVWAPGIQVTDAFCR
jgi:heme/copper-type cytochrome/quinol oxidase subunit 1